MNNLLLNVFIILLFTLGSYAVTYFLKGRYTQWTNGFLSGLAVILCMSFPFKLLPGQVYDLRIVILLLGILYGGYGVGIFVIGITFFYRYLIGGFGFIQMVLTFSPILAFAFYLLPRFKDYPRTKKILCAVNLVLAIVVLNIIFVIAKYPITGRHIWFLIEWAFIEALGMAVMVFIIEIMNENIRMTKRMQELEKNQLVYALTASIAHEIRNPLTVCRGFLQLLTEIMQDEKQLSYTNIILSELDHAGSIIDNYLAFSKPKVEKMVQIDTTQIVAHAIETITPFSTLKNVEIVQNSEEEHLYIYVDSAKFEQAILNVMKNGIEAMADGGTLRIDIHRHNHMVAIDIIDAGVGMTKEQLGRLGKPFYSTRTTGTGLGLMTTYRFIHLMRGKIEVHSIRGQGTQFSVYIPLTNEVSPNMQKSSDQPDKSNMLLPNS